MQMGMQVVWLLRVHKSNHKRLGQVVNGGFQPDWKSSAGNRQSENRHKKHERHEKVLWILVFFVAIFLTQGCGFAALSCFSVLLSLCYFIGTCPNAASSSSTLL